MVWATNISTKTLLLEDDDSEQELGEQQIEHQDNMVEKKGSISGSLQRITLFWTDLPRISYFPFFKLYNGMQVPYHPQYLSSCGCLSRCHYQIIPWPQPIDVLPFPECHV